MTRPLVHTELQTVRAEVSHAGVVQVTLDRSDAGNSRNQQMRQELQTVYDAAVDDDDVRVLVLTGAGDRFFCTGMDLKEARAGETPNQRRARLRAGRDIDVLAQLPIPTIAAVNGYALGGGLEMALACDLRVVAAEAQVGLPELGHGLVPGGGGTQRLPRLIGVARTMELLFTGRRVGGDEAVSIGLATASVPLSGLADAVRELAEGIARQPPAALLAAKELVLRSQDTPLAAGLDLELEALLGLLDGIAPEPSP